MSSVSSSLMYLCTIYLYDCSGANANNINKANTRNTGSIGFVFVKNSKHVQQKLFAKNKISVIERCKSGKLFNTSNKRELHLFLQIISTCISKCCVSFCKNSMKVNCKVSREKKLH